MLDSTRSELTDFYQASKEVEAELESEIQRNEKIQLELRAKVDRTESERDNWKAGLHDEASNEALNPSRIDE